MGLNLLLLFSYSHGGAIDVLAVNVLFMCIIYSFF